MYARFAVGLVFLALKLRRRGVALKISKYLLRHCVRVRRNARLNMTTISLSAKMPSLIHHLGGFYIY